MKKTKLRHLNIKTKDSLKDVSSLLENIKITKETIEKNKINVDCILEEVDEEFENVQDESSLGQNTI